MRRYAAHSTENYGEIVWGVTYKTSLVTDYTCVFIKQTCSIRCIKRCILQSAVGVILERYGRMIPYILLQTIAFSKTMQRYEIAVTFRPSCYCLHHISNIQYILNITFSFPISYRGPNREHLEPCTPYCCKWRSLRVMCESFDRTHRRDRMTTHAIVVPFASLRECL
jgi:hypothetical protein